MPFSCAIRGRLFRRAAAAVILLLVAAGLFFLLRDRAPSTTRRVADSAPPRAPAALVPAKSPWRAAAVAPPARSRPLPDASTRVRRAPPPVPEGPPVRVISSDPRRTVFRCTAAGWTLEPAALDDGTACTAVRPPPGYSPMRRKGWPELPWTSAKLVLPSGGVAPSLRVLHAEFEEIACAPPLPSPGFVSRAADSAVPARAFDAAYAAAGRFPAAPAGLGAVHTVGSDRCVLVTFQPFSYDAASGTLRVCRELEVEVDSGLPGTMAAPPAPALRRAAPDLGRIVRAAAAAPASATRGDAGSQAAASSSSSSSGLPGDGGRLLVVVPDAWISAVADFVSWKRQRGMDVLVARYPADTGTGTTALGAYIRARAADAAGLGYVVLVGDAGDIPCGTGTSACPSDTLYSLADSADIYQDWFVSRVSAVDAAGAKAQLARFIGYEKTPGSSGGTSWMRRGLCIASDQDNSGTFAMDKTEMEALRTKWLAGGFTDVTAVYDPGATTAHIRTAANAGCGLVFYLGHGSATAWTTGSFDAASAFALQNAHMLPLVVSGACTTGDFTLSSGLCLAEGWMRAGTEAAPAGAAGFVGATTAMDWDPPVRLEQTVSDYWLNATVRSAGAFAFGGVQSAMDFCYAADPVTGGSAARKVMEQTHLFGDCSLEIRELPPAAVTVQHADVVPPGAPYAVTVLTQGTTPAPVQGATVCLFRDGDIQAAAATDASGVASLTVDGAEGGALTLTVYKNDIVPYQAAVPLASGPLRVLGASAPAAFTGEDYAFSPVAAGGQPPYSWSCSDPLPPGLELDPATGRLHGVVAEVGSWSLTLRLADSATPAASASLTVTVQAGAAVTLGTDSLPAGTVLAPYDFTLAATGSFTPFTFDIASGALPPGIGMDASGVFSGTPTLAGSWPLALRVTDAKGRTSVKTLTLAVAAAATLDVLTAAALPSGDAGESYYLALQAAGGSGAGFAWTVADGALPEGMALAPDGTLSGIPDAAGVYRFTVCVTDNSAVPHSGQKAFTLMVNQPVVFEATPLPLCVSGLAFSAAVPAAGSYGPFTLTVSGTQDFTTETLTHADYTVAGERLAGATDETETAVDLPFAFPFCGRSYTRIRVGDNGYIIPGDNPGPAAGYYWDADAAVFSGLAMIAPFWNDLVISADDPDSGVFVQKSADRVTIFWRGREYDHRDWWLNFGVTLHADGRCRFFYGGIQTLNRTVAGISGGSASLPFRRLLAYEKSPLAPTWAFSADWNAHDGVLFVPVQPLPGWLALGADGVLRGTPPAAGVYQFSILAADTHNFQAVKVFSLTVEPPETFTLTLSPGWNLAGVPLRLTDERSSAVFQGCGAVFGRAAAAGPFGASPPVRPCRGYWVWLPGDAPLALTLTGAAVPDADAVAALAPGWNLVAPLAELKLPTRFPAPAWGWSGGAFLPQETLRPGNAYWIFTPAADTLNLRTGQ